ncbi:hypothetical protein [Paenibacillus xylanilyticus]|uniref:hypothetical protein n=1 Tax=Paenibacillus xylanilyticus TaxID=248903 RepID=UPI003AABD2F8
MPDNSDNSNQTNFDPESCDAILDTAKIIYAEEAERFKQTETKTSIGLAFDGIVIGAYITYLSAFSPTGKEVTYLIYTYLLKIGILALLSISAFYFIKSIKGVVFDQVDLNNIVDEDFAREPVGKVKIDIAHTYNDVVNSNTSKLEEKVKFFDKGLLFMYWGFIIFIIHFVIEEIIKNVK